MINKKAFIQTCHCEERSGEVISLGNNKPTKDMSFRGENDNLARRGNPGQKCRNKSAGLLRSRQSLAMTWNEKRKAAFTQSCHPELVSGSKNKMLKHLTALPTDAGSHTSPLALWFPLRSQHDMSVSSRKKAAFTLAETLITLMVIGVVAALTIPSLMQQLGDYTLNKQRDVFSKKFAEGLRQMRIDEKLAEKYNSTADFVAEMQKYFKIVGVCNKDDLSGCFGDNFTYHDDMTDLSFTTSNLKTTDDIASVTGHDLGFDADVMGVDFSDGTQMLIMVNPDCTGIAGGDTQGNHYSCFKYIADVNGKKSPSAVGKDLMSNINMAALDFEIADVTTNSPAASNGSYGTGAVDYCKNKGLNLASTSQLLKLAEKSYKNCEQIADKEYGNCIIANNTILNNFDIESWGVVCLRSSNSADGYEYDLVCFANDRYYVSIDDTPFWYYDQYFTMCIK